jgi:molecular chaperone DnaK (HSP70)
VEGEELHGGQAKTQFVRNAKNTVAYFRDFLGKECVHAISEISLLC